MRQGFSKTTLSSVVLHILQYTISVSAPPITSQKSTSTRPPLLRPEQQSLSLCDQCTGRYYRLICLGVLVLIHLAIKYNFQKEAGHFELGAWITVLNVNKLLWFNHTEQRTTFVWRRLHLLVSENRGTIKFGKYVAALIHSNSVKV